MDDPLVQIQYRHESELVSSNVSFSHEKWLGDFGPVTLIQPMMPGSGDKSIPVATNGQYLLN